MLNSDANNNTERLPAGFDLNLAIRLLDKKIELVRTTNKMAAIRAMFDHIIKMQREGASIEDVLECLNEAGLDVTAKTLNTYLMRIKRERGLTRGKKKARSAVAKPAPAPAKHQDETPEPPGQFGQSLVRTTSKAADKEQRPPAPEIRSDAITPEKMKERIAGVMDDVNNRYV